MQEKFALRKTLKKVAAVGTSLALVGVTVSGALAAGLGDLPAPFGSSPATNVVVFGSSADDAAVDDVVAALGGLPGGASTTVVGGSLGELTLEDFETGEREDVDVATAFNAADPGWAILDETDSVGLVDGEITLDHGTDTDYDYHEEIQFTALAVLSTALEGIDAAPATKTGADERFGDNVFVAIDDDAMGYYITLEEQIDEANVIAPSPVGDDACPGAVNGAGVTADNPAHIPFLGKDLVITAATVNTITAFAGDQHILRAGDSVVVGGSTVTLDGADANSAWVIVDGEVDSINEDDSERVGNCEVYVDDVLNSDTDDANDRAILIVACGEGGSAAGVQALDTYNTGDEFIGQTEGEELWSWHISGMDGTDSALVNGRGDADATACEIEDFVLGVTLEEGLDSATQEFSDEVMEYGLLKSSNQYLVEGDYLCLPWRHACVLLEGPEADLDFSTYEFIAGEGEDLSANADLTDAADFTNAQTLKIEAKGVGNDRGLLAGAGTGLIGSVAVQTDTIWLQWDAAIGTLDLNGDGDVTDSGECAFVVTPDLNGDNDVLDEGEVAATGVVRVYRADRDTNRAVLVDLDGDGTLEPNGTLRAHDEGCDGVHAAGDVDTIAEQPDANLDLGWFGNVGGDGIAGSPAEIMENVIFAVIDNGDYTANIGVSVDEIVDEGVAGADLTFHIGSRDGDANRFVNFYATIGAAADGIDFLGNQDGDDTVDYFCYGDANGVCTDAGDVALSSYDEDVRKMDGVVLLNPENNIDNDDVFLSVPDDNEFEYWVRVAKPVGGSTTTTTGTAAASLSMTDDETGDVLALNKNVVAVGGPCVNAATRALLDLGEDPVCGADSGLEADTGVLELKDLDNGKKALLAYGWEADDTRRAALVVRNPAQFSAQLEGKNSVTVTGTDLTVSGITVA